MDSLLPPHLCSIKTPSLEHLQHIHSHLLTTLKYENLSFWYSKKRVLVAEKSLYEKFTSGRGGVCVELNMMYRAVLIESGFQVQMVTSRIVFGQEDHKAVKSRDTHLVLLVKCRSSESQYVCDIGTGDFVPSGPMFLNDGTLSDGPAKRKMKLSKKEGDEWLFEAFDKAAWKPFYVFNKVEGVRDEDYFQEMVDFVSTPSNNLPPLNGKFCCRVWPDLSQIIVYGDFTEKGITIVRLSPTGDLVEKIKIHTEAEFRQSMITYFEIDIEKIVL